MSRIGEIGDNYWKQFIFCLTVCLSVNRENVCLDNIISILSSMQKIFFSSPYVFPLVVFSFLFYIILNLAPLSEDWNRLASLTFFKLLFSLWIKPWVLLLLLLDFLLQKNMFKYIYVCMCVCVCVCVYSHTNNKNFSYKLFQWEKSKYFRMNRYAKFCGLIHLKKYIYIYVCVSSLKNIVQLVEYHWYF